jgi:glycosyltransferase involved in cell wall biosynthesis
MNDPLVSICCITYNHSRFIRDTIDGFLMQKTNFPFEVIIHDDASTDGTADVVRRYAAEHPDVILPILQTENQWSRGEDVSETFVWPRARGKYIALCEGDDFWVDPYKLQKEVDFLEAHPSCVMVATKIRCVNSEGADLLNNSILDNQARNTKRDISFFDLLEENCISRLRPASERTNSGRRPGTAPGIRTITGTGYSSAALGRSTSSTT